MNPEQRVGGDTIVNHHEACPAQRLKALGASCHRATKQRSLLIAQGWSHGQAETMTDV